MGANLRDMRRDRGLTLTALSSRSGVNIGTLSHIERGNRAATPGTVTALAKALGVTVAKMRQLLGEADAA